MTKEWLLDINKALVQRNAREVDPYEQIYPAYADMFHRYHVYEQQRSSLRHRLSLIESDVHELSKDEYYSEAVQCAKKGFGALQSHLVQHTFLPPVSSEGLFSLNKLIIEQRKLIVNLQEEAKLAKDQHREALERLAGIEEERGKGNEHQPKDT